MHLGLLFHGIRRDDVRRDGTASFEQALQARKQDADVVYITPTHQGPFSQRS